MLLQSLSHNCYCGLVTFVSLRMKDFWRKEIQIELMDGYGSFLPTYSFYQKNIEMEGILKVILISLLVSKNG